MKLSDVKYGVKIYLNSDFTNEYGYKYKKGQTGIVGCDPIDDFFYISLDGYEEERRRAAENTRKYNEPPNIVPWITEVPLNILSQR